MLTFLHCAWLACGGDDTAPTADSAPGDSATTSVVDSGPTDSEPTDSETPCDPETDFALCADQGWDCDAHDDLIIDAGGQPHAVVGSASEGWYVGVRDGAWSTSTLDDVPHAMHVFLEGSDRPWACWYDQDPETQLLCAH